MDLDALIDAVNNGQPQNRSDLEAFVAMVADGSVSTEDATRWLKAVHQHGCKVDDIVVLTNAMINSGARLTWAEGPPVVDKHSTGGVGDKMSLMLAPALAAAGCRVPMLAGRGLGHTGGTIDKLESIPGFNCALTPDEMVAAVEKIGCCIAVQNNAIAPADGVLYALRDVTDTIDSVPLITASIVSKKAAEGLNALVLDVKTGTAAFMQTVEEARTLATSMVKTAEGLGIRTRAQITMMTEPIGTHIGNALEVLGSILVLKGEGSPDTRELVVMQGAALLSMTFEGVDMKEGRRRMEHVLTNGEALEVFRKMCVQQGVEPEVAAELISHPEKVLGTAPEQTTVLAWQDGFVSSYDAMKMAKLARKHGAGRFALEDEIDPLVGFLLQAPKGTQLQKNQPLFTFYHTRELSSDDLQELKSIAAISENKPDQPHRLVELIDSAETKA
jgi:thymidine phosphorylase